MAEPGGFDARRFLLAGGVAAVVIFSVLFFLFRGCAPATGPGGKRAGYTVIYSNLELKDAANVIARLKEIAVPYEIRDEGRAIAVPKEKADQARLGLAEKNLPMGGVVGWEIFNEARLGATDFDRRIQLVRAISGELSRTIRRIGGVEDAWVQVVIPETKLFAATTAPVTASVMLRLRPGFLLAPSKINGIVYLVASSVENLQPENVIVVDDSGRILTTRAITPTGLAAVPPPPAETIAVLVTPEMAAPAKPEVVLTKEKPVMVKAAVTPTPEAKTTVEAMAGKPSPLTAEERVLLKARAKKELEQDLSGKAQELLNRFYPINSAIVRASVELKPLKDEEIRARDLKVKSVKAIVLIDNRVDLKPNLKKATYTTVAAAVGYDRKRGDMILIQKVPFHLAAPPLPRVKAPVQPEGVGLQIPRRFWWLVGGVSAAFLLIVLIVSFLRRGSVKPEAVMEEAPRPRPAAGFARERVSALDQVKSAAERNPEQIAELLKSWLSE